MLKKTCLRESGQQTGRLKHLQTLAKAGAVQSNCRVLSEIQEGPMMRKERCPTAISTVQYLLDFLL